MRIFSAFSRSDTERKVVIIQDCALFGVATEAAAGVGGGEIGPGDGLQGADANVERSTVGIYPFLDSSRSHSEIKGRRMTYLWTESI